MSTPENAQRAQSKLLDVYEREIIKPILEAEELEDYNDDLPLVIQSESLKGYVDDLYRMQKGEKESEGDSK